MSQGSGPSSGVKFSDLSCHYLTSAKNYDDDPHSFQTTVHTHDFQILSRSKIGIVALIYPGLCNIDYRCFKLNLIFVKRSLQCVFQMSAQKN